MRTGDRVKVLHEYRDSKRRIFRAKTTGTIVSEPRYSVYGYIYHWVIIDPLETLS